MTKKPSPRGRTPLPKEIAAKKADGYFTAQAVAKKYGKSLATVHRWANRWRPTKGEAFAPMTFGGKVGAYSDGNVVWILAKAVEATIAARDERAA